MKKTHRVTFRTTEEVRDRLIQRAYENQRDSMSQEAHAILEKALGIKRAKKAAN
jgi:hypothetical protein